MAQLVRHNFFFAPLVVIVPLIAATVSTQEIARAGDWPQALGPQRNGSAAPDERLPETLPRSLSPLWSLPLGQGYAGPIVQGQSVYVFHHEDGQECLQSVDLRRGKVQWRREFEANYRGGVDPDQGPRCAPIAIGERILAFGAAGSLHCVRAEDGELLWTRDLYADYSGDEGFFGAGSCPLVVGDRVLVNVGGRRDAGIVAISLENGRTLWQTTTEAASYSAPIVVQREEKSLALFITRMNTVLMDPSSGKVLGTRPFGKRGPTVNAASPLLIGTSAFLTSSYGVGAALVRLDSPTLEPLWQNDTTLSSQYNTPVLHDGFLYGIHGREDHGPAELRCVEAQTGEVRWAERGFGVAHIILANGRLLLVKVDGTIVLAQATPEAYRELGRCSVTNRVTRALPALSNGRLLLRDNSTRDGRLMCFEL